MSLTLNYLPVEAKAEPTRLVLQYGKVPYVDNVVPFSAWPEVKQKCECQHFGQLPSLTLANGTVISQSGAIVRYAAKLAKCCPDTPEGCAEADMIVELVQDMNAINPIAVWHEVGSDDFKKAHTDFFASLPARLTALQRILGSKPFYGGGATPSYGDLALFHIMNQVVKVEPKSLDAYSAMSAWHKSIAAIPQIKAYLETRPTKATPGYGKPGSLFMQ